ncbi:hypothetical protein CLV63_10997 [Murinocardiopsis flavida]|uniref:Uncharacterized protein n=1 Tax=Murinocardiopsis flavida TaxID=645275 RepID=A0A2P8DIQ1_9ACTN|nr:hypothetical protein [Murinocardiopsis flavida]PSK97094.1 hypothetical protein CLV63_10997 [Murinocardiopsis flavida]
MVIPPVTDVRGRPNGMLALLLTLITAMFVFAVYLTFGGVPCEQYTLTEITSESAETELPSPAPVPEELLDSGAPVPEELLGSGAPVPEDLRSEVTVPPAPEATPPAEGDTDDALIAPAPCVGSASTGRGLWAAGSGIVLIWMYRRIRNGRAMDVPAVLLAAILLTAVWLLAWPSAGAAEAAVCGGPVVDPSGACPETQGRLTRVLFLMLFAVPLAMGVVRRDVLAAIGARPDGPGGLAAADGPAPTGPPGPQGGDRSEAGQHGGETGGDKGGGAGGSRDAGRNGDGAPDQGDDGDDGGAAGAADQGGDDGGRRP